MGYIDNALHSGVNLQSLGTTTIYAMQYKLMAFGFRLFQSLNNQFSKLNVYDYTKYNAGAPSFYSQLCYGYCKYLMYYILYIYIYISMHS